MFIRRLLHALILVTLTIKPASALLCGTFLDPMSVSVTPLAFGNYFPVATNTNSVTVGVSCGLLGADVLPAFSVSVSAGNAANPASRYMSLGAAQLSYNIYTSPAYNKVWGDGSSGSITQSYNGLLSLGTINFTGYGKLPSGQYVATGTYSDQLIVTVSY